MMYPRPVDPEEAKWQRRDDARTLARAEEIKADKERLKNAHIGAKEILEEEAARLKGLSKVASNTTVNAAVRQAEKANKEEKQSKVQKPFREGRFAKNPATIGRL